MRRATLSLCLSAFAMAAVLGIAPVEMGQGPFVGPDIPLTWSFNGWAWDSCEATMIRLVVDGTMETMPDIYFC